MNEYIKFLQKALETSSTIEEVREKHISMLRYEHGIISSVYAAKLESANRVHTEVYMNVLKQEWKKVKENLEENFGKSGVKFEITSRIKDYIGLNKKILLYLKKGKSLERIKDVMGIRIVIGSEKEDSEETIKLCYDVMNEILRYFIIERSCILAESEILIDHKPKKQPNVIIPKENYINPIFESNIKDYIRFPKENGYQSLHAVLKNTNEISFEIQVRTRAMHIRAETGSASHKPYKDKRYSEVGGEINFSKIHLEGFDILEDGTVIDKIGLIKSISPF